MEKQRSEKSEKRQSQTKEDAVVRKGRKVAIHCVFRMICGSRGSESRLAKAAGVEPSVQMRVEKAGALLAVDMSKKCTALWREANFEVKSVKYWPVRSTRSTCTKHLMFGPPLGLTCRTGARGCDGCGALLDVDMLKKCTPLWREAHFEVKV